MWKADAKCRKLKIKLTELGVYEIQFCIKSRSMVNFDSARINGVKFLCGIQNMESEGQS